MDPLILRVFSYSSFFLIQLLFVTSEFILNLILIWDGICELWFDESFSTVRKKVTQNLHVPLIHCESDAHKIPRFLKLNMFALFLSVARLKKNKKIIFLIKRSIPIYMRILLSMPENNDRNYFCINESRKLWLNIVQIRSNSEQTLEIKQPFINQYIQCYFCVSVCSLRPSNFIKVRKMKLFCGWSV